MPLRLEAYVDDSASEVGDRRLFLAAYINEADQWAAFSSAWSAVLASPPAIAYFKMVEAQNLRGQFKGWSAEARDAKVMDLADLIPRFRCWSAHASVSREDYAAILKPASPEPLKAPYFACWWTLIDTVAQYHASLGFQGMPPVDFTFDQQDGVGDDAALWYGWLKDGRNEIREHLGATPVFRDDKFVPALQAADMLAWHIRRRHERGEESAAFRLLVGDGLHAYRDIDAATLRGWAAAFRQVPGVDLVQSKAEWRETRKVVRAAVAAGMGPPQTDPIYLHLLNIRVRARRFVRKAHQRIRQSLRRRSAPQGKGGG